MTDDTDPTPTRRALLRAAAGTGAVGLGSTAGCVNVITPVDRAERTAVQGNIGYLVGVPWLADNRDDVVVLDARNRERFRAERIYGARHVPLDRVTQQHETGRGLAPDTDAIATAFADRGLDPTDDVVVYGASIGSRVTRVVFALEAVGHEGAVRVLNGGFDPWTGRVGTGPAGSTGSTAYEPQPNEELWCTRGWLAEHVGSFNADGPALVDCRTPEAYLGAAGSAALNPENDRHGHLPGALNVHWVGNVAGRQLTAPGDLVQMYEGEGELDRDEPTVVYGDKNVNPTSTWLTLRAVGFEDVRLYDGGFAEWANVDTDRGRHPVETATNVVVETDGELGGEDSSGDFSCTG